MKIDLSVTITAEILNALISQAETGHIPSVEKFGHIGTHFDIMDKEFHLDNTKRRGKLFDVSHVQGRDIEISDIDTSRIDEHDFVLFHTGWLNKHGYGTPAYFTNHPELSQTLISYLVDRNVSMIGIDAAGIRKPAEHLEADIYCANNGIFVIENLANLGAVLEQAGTQDVTMHTYPVNYQGLSGLPCRVIAEIEGLEVTAPPL